MENQKEINNLAKDILNKYTPITVLLTHMTLFARPAVPDFQFSLKRSEYNIYFKGTELILQCSFNGYRVSLLDTYHYGCPVHIATFAVSKSEIQKIQDIFGGDIKDGMLDCDELMESIIMPEKERLLGFKN